MLTKELPTTASLHPESASHDDHEQRNRLTDPRVTPVSSPAPISSDSKSSPEKRSLFLDESELSILREDCECVDLCALGVMIYGFLVVFLAAVSWLCEVSGMGLDRQDLSGSLSLQIATNFPDPSILYDNGMWYAYATNQGANVISEGFAVHNGKHFVQPPRANIQGAY